MPITSNEEKQLRELINALNKANRRENTFTKDETRYSSEGDHPSDVSGIIKKYWKKWEEKTIDKAVIQKMKRAETDFIKHIESLTRELEDAGETISKTVMESFGHVLKRKSKKAQEAALTSLQDYTEKVGKLNDLIQQSKTKHTKELGEAIRESIKEVNETAEKTRDLGIAVEDVTAEYDKAAKHYKVTNLQLEEYNKQLQTTTSRITNENKNFVSNLKKHHSEELTARAAMTKAMINAGIQIAGVAGNFASIAESRLSNVLDDTRFVEALRTGLSPQEINEWNNLNRNSLRLMGDSADGFSIEMQNTLHQFGLFGKAAMEQITTLNRIGFNSGIVSGQSSNTSMQETIGRIQALQGVSQSEATRILEDIANSTSFQASIVGKDQDERLRLLNQQAFNLARISRNTGFTSEYTQKLWEEQQSAKYKSVIDSVKASVMTGPLLDQIEAATGVQATDEQRNAMRLKLSGAVLNEQETEAYLQYRRNAGPAVDRFFTDSRRAIGTGDFSSVGRSAVLEQFSGAAGENLQELGQSGLAAANRELTMAAATQDQKFYDEQLRLSRESLHVLEEMWGEAAREYGPGISQNPAGSLLGSIGSGAWNMAQGYLAYRGLTGGSNLLARGWQGLRGAGGSLLNMGRTGIASARTGIASATAAGGRALSAGRAALPGIARAAPALARNAPGIGMAVDMGTGGQDGLARAAGLNSSSDVNSMGQFLQMLGVGTGMYSASALTLGSSSAREINFASSHALDMLSGMDKDDALRAYLQEVRPEERGWASNIDLSHIPGLSLLPTNMTMGIGAQADALAARDAMATGQQLDANGNLVAQADENNSFLRRIVETIEEGLGISKEEQEARKEKESRDEGRSLLQQRAEESRNNVTRANQGLRATAQAHIRSVETSF